MTRTEAIASGLSTYWTGKPCKHGHVAERYVQNWTCVTCHAVKAAEYLPKWRANNPEKQQQYSKKYSQTHSESTKKWRTANPDKQIEYRKHWNSLNRDKRNEMSRNWRLLNRGIVNDLKAKRRADILNRTPAWLTADDKWVIREAYLLAKMRSKLTGFAWHVDHVIPLRGKRVSGLHVPLNIQVIPGIENALKGNKYATR